MAAGRAPATTRLSAVAVAARAQAAPALERRAGRRHALCATRHSHSRQPQLLSPDGRYTMPTLPQPARHGQAKAQKPSKLAKAAPCTLLHAPAPEPQACTGPPHATARAQPDGRLYMLEPPAELSAGARHMPRIVDRGAV
eukprot:scaffold15056_cov101-Isochrysis_galbana.AAC.4